MTFSADPLSILGWLQEQGRNALAIEAPYREPES